MGPSKYRHWQCLFLRLSIAKREKASNYSSKLQSGIKVHSSEFKYRKSHRQLPPKHYMGLRVCCQIPLKYVKVSVHSHSRTLTPHKWQLPFCLCKVNRTSHHSLPHRLRRTLRPNHTPLRILVMLRLLQTLQRQPRLNSLFHYHNPILLPSRIHLNGFNSNQRPRTMENDGLLSNTTPLLLSSTPMYET